jgi:hypothetical protein
VGSIPGRVKPRTIKLVFVASPLSTQHYGERAKIDWLGIEHANHYATDAVLLIDVTT